MRRGDAIAKEIAAPRQLKLGLDFQAHRLDMHVVPFAGPQHQPMRAETDGSLVTIGRLVNDVQPTHGSGPHGSADKLSDDSGAWRFRISET
jgi:hypothetical protein